MSTTTKKNTGFTIKPTTELNTAKEKKWQKRWIEHVMYTCNQFVATRDTFIQDTPPSTNEDNGIVYWNCMVDSFMHNSGVLASFFTIGYKPDHSRYAEFVKGHKDDCYMRQLDTSFTLTSAEYDRLRDWQEVVEHTVYRLSAHREEMLRDRLSKGREVVDILDPLITVVRSQLEDQKYTW
jgi:hypothetical protein